MKHPSKLGFLIYCLESTHKGSTTLLVGGCVRDFVLGIEPKDFDLVTDVNIEQVHETLARSGFSVDTVGKQFLVLIASKDGESYEISNFRKDSEASDGRHPENVTIGTLEEDANRRDFTVNAMYYNINTKEIITPIKQSMYDCLNRTLKFIGSPKSRIKEDYLRVFRFYRFLKEKGLTPDSKSMSACRTYFDDAIKNTSSERIRCEIERML